MPALVLAHVREQRAAVDVADRVEPVVARRSAGLVDLDRLARLEPDGLEAEVRPSPAPADGDEQLRRRCLVPSSSVTVTSPSRATATARQPVRTSTPGLAQRRLDLLRRRTAPRARSARGEPLEQGDLRAERGPRLRELDADDAAAEDDEALRDLLGRRRLAVRPRAAPRRGPGSAARTRPLPVAITTACRARARRRRRRRAARRRAAVAAHERRRRAPRARAPGPSRRDRGSPRRARASTGGDVEPVGAHARARAPPRPAARPAAAAPWTACRRRRSTRRRRGAARRARPETALAEAPGGDLAGRAGADHDDVEAALGHPSESCR